MNKEGFVVAKFGGTSVGLKEGRDNIPRILDANPDRKIAVVSAPRGMTPVLERLSGAERKAEKTTIFRREVVPPFREMAKEVGFKEIDDLLNKLRDGIGAGKPAAWIESRGEWITAQILAPFLSAYFVEAVHFIRANLAGEIDESSYRAIGQATQLYLQHHADRIIVPGYYYSDAQGEVQLFPKGGSDISGAVIAVGTQAKLYENWTDTNGVLTADYKKVKGTQTIPEMTFKEMRELGYRGAGVLQKDAILHVARAQIPVHVRNTFDPAHEGTVINVERASLRGEQIIGISGRGGFTSVEIEKLGMNEGKTDVDTLMALLHDTHGVPFDHDPTGMDNVSLLIQNDALSDNGDALTADIRFHLAPESVSKKEGLGLICVVGQNILQHHTAVAARLFTSLDRADITTYGISSSTVGTNIVIAVSENNLNEAMQVVHDEFF